MYACARARARARNVDPRLAPSKKIKVSQVIQRRLFRGKKLIRDAPALFLSPPPPPRLLSSPLRVAFNIRLEVTTQLAFKLKFRPQS